MVHSRQVGSNARYPWEEKMWEKSFSSALEKLGAIADDSSGSDDSVREGALAQAGPLRRRGGCVLKRTSAASDANV